MHKAQLDNLDDDFLESYDQIFFMAIEAALSKSKLILKSFVQSFLKKLKIFK